MTDASNPSPEHPVDRSAGDAPVVVDGPPRRGRRVGRPTVLIGALLLAVIVAGVLTDRDLLIEQRAVEHIDLEARDLTRRQEGLILQPYQPEPGSGVTIGYGYDMRDKTGSQIAAELGAVEPSIRRDWIDRLATAAGMSGDVARDFALTNADIALNDDQALDLFDATYEREAALARDFATNPDAYAEFGSAYPSADWEALHPAVRGVVIDLKYRGDYRPWWELQQQLQERIAANDPHGVLEQLRDITIFPADLATRAHARFDARIEWLERLLGG